MINEVEYARFFSTIHAFYRHVHTHVNCAVAFPKIRPWHAMHGVVYGSLERFLRTADQSHLCHLPTCSVPIPCANEQVHEMYAAGAITNVSWKLYLTS